MRKIAQSIVIIAACFTVFGNAAHAEENAVNGLNQVSFSLAYADPDFDDANASLFSKFDLGDEDHELNDAWLGMLVKSIDGKLVGTVTYAFLDVDGEISELLVELGASQLSYSVYIDASTAKLSEIDVIIGLNATQIVSLEREQPSKFAQN